MNEFTPQWYKEQCAKLLLRPEKMRGQHFLVNRTIAAKIADAAKISETDTVLEIGPGFGILTTELVGRAGKVIAVEAENKFHEGLDSRVRGNDMVNVEFEFVNEDILQFDERTLPQNYILVSNLPYSITSPVLEKFLLSENPPSKIVLMLQKEVVDRIIATLPRMNRLAILVQLMGKPKFLFNVTAGNFWPAPKVVSAVVVIEVNKQNETIKKITAGGATVQQFLKFVAVGFSNPRKKLSNNLASLYPSSKELFLQKGIDPNARPETLSLAYWLELFLCSMT